MDPRRPATLRFPENLAGENPRCQHPNSRERACLRATRSAVVWLVLLIVAVAAHWLAEPDRRAARAQPADGAAHFYGAAPMALITVGAGAVLVGRELIGERAARCYAMFGLSLVQRPIVDGDLDIMGVHLGALGTSTEAGRRCCQHAR